MNDDLDDDLSLDGSFDEFEKKEKSLGDMWRENPLFKIGVIAVSAVLIFIIISLFGGNDDKIDPSYIGATPDIVSTPGTDEASPAYVQAIEELNEAEVERALNEGDSAIPVPIEPPVGIVSLPEQDNEEEDPLQRWRRLQEERLQRELQQRRSVEADRNVDNTGREEAIELLSDAMAEQMSSILESQDSVSLYSLSLTDPDFLEQLQEEENAELEQEELLEDEEVVGEVLLPAGEIAYAQLLTEANTDSPGPVLAEIMSGPLKGSRILGTFEEQSELLTLNFDTIVYEEQSLSVDAVALDPDTTLAGMATEVDHRYFKRIILPAAAAFVEGAANAIAESGRTTITIEGETVAESEEEADSEQEIASGVEEAGQELREILDEMDDDVEVLVRIEAGTPIGVLFLESVTTDEDT